MKALLLFVVLLETLAGTARAEDGPCVEPPHNKYDRLNGVETCYYDAAKQKKLRSTTYDDGHDIGPMRRWREDGTLQEVIHTKANVKEYRTNERYYETGGVRSVEFESPHNTIIVGYTVGGQIHKISCTEGGYAYSVESCQPKASFPIKTWRPTP